MTTSKTRDTVEVKQTARVEFQTIILNADGSVFKRNPWRKNLILDQGLDNIISSPWPAMLTRCKIGTGTNPTQRDSGTITFTQAANTVTASAGFFVSGDVGRLLKMDSGEESYITGFTSSSIVTVFDSRTVVAQEGTIWYVNRTALQTQTKDTGVYGSDGGDNGTTFSLGNTFTHQRTFIFPAESGSVTYNEIGWGPSIGAFIFGMAIISGGDTLTTGQQYKVVVRIIVVVSPATSTAFGDVGNNGFVTTGTASFTDSGGFAFIGGGLEAGKISDPSGPKPIAWLVSPMVLGSLAGGPGTRTVFPTTNGGSAVAQGYVTGSFTRTWILVEPVGATNGVDIRGFWNKSGALLNNGLSYRFDNAQTKDSNHTLTITLRHSWGRTLVN